MTGSDGHIDFDLLPTHLTGGCFGNTANDTLYALHPHFQFHNADSAIMLKQSDFVCTTIIVTNTPPNFEPCSNQNQALCRRWNAATDLQSN